LTPSTSDLERYQRVVAALKRLRGVSMGTSSKQGFGATALTANGKIFAMLSSKGQFVVKLPRERVDTLVAEGYGARFDPGRGRLMKEWFVPGAEMADSWLPLAKEALSFVRNA